MFNGFPDNFLDNITDILVFLLHLRYKAVSEVFLQ